MNLEAAKMQLIERVISTEKVSVLKKLKEILDSEQNMLRSEDYKIIDARRERHLKGESDSFSWEQVKQKIQHRKI